MENEFWLERWQQGQTAFHLDRPNPLLLKHWPSLSVPVGASVFVPLCGKSHDLQWLASQGYQVSGVELSPVAIESFFKEHRLAFEKETIAGGYLWRSDNLRFFEVDFFALDAEILGSIDFVFDRAALIALPQAMRKRYVDRINQLTGKARTTLLITLEYDQSVMNGPPFSVPEQEVTALFAGDFSITRLSNDDILEKMPRFKERGLTALREPVYLLTPTV